MSSNDPTKKSWSFPTWPKKLNAYQSLSEDQTDDAPAMQTVELDPIERDLSAIQEAFDAAHQSDETLMSLNNQYEPKKGFETIEIQKTVEVDETQEPIAPPEPWYKQSIGLIYMLLATVLFSVMSMAVKTLSKSEERIPVLELVVIRGIVGFLVASFMIWYHSVPTYFGPTGTHYLLFVRGFTGFLALTFNFWTLTTLSLGDATVLGFLSPTFTGIFGKIFLGENWEVCLDHVSLCA